MGVTDMGVCHRYGMGVTVTVGWVSQILVGVIDMGWVSQLWNKRNSHAMCVTVMKYVRFEVKHLWVSFLKETPVMRSVSQLWDRCHSY